MDFIVCNTKQGNTAAATLLSRLIDQVDVLQRELSSFKKRLEDLSPLISDNKQSIAILEKTVESHFALFQDKENKELRSQLDTQDKKIDEIYEMISRINQPALEEEEREKDGLVMKSYDTTAINDVVSKLDDIASQLIPKAAINKRRSVFEDTFAPLLQGDNMYDVNTTEDSSDLRQKSLSMSSGIGSTLNCHDSKILSDIEEGPEPDDINADDPELLHLMADSQTISSVPLRQKSSTPAITRAKSMTSKEHNIIEAIWAMSDLAASLKKLLETD